MRSKPILLSFLISLAVIPVAFLLVLDVDGPTDRLTFALYGAAIVVEALAFVQALISRRVFDEEDWGRTVWTLFSGFLGIRLLGEFRYVSLLVNGISSNAAGISTTMFVYIVVFRYLFTAADLLCLAGLIRTVREYRASGFEFRLLRRDWFYIGALWIMPIVPIIYPAQNADGYLRAYWLVATTVGTLIASIGMVVRRYAQQMGVGALARVWTTVVIACTARAASFPAISLASQWLPDPVTDFVEQYPIWIFANCWLLAAVLQQSVLRRAEAEQTYTRW